MQETELHFSSHDGASQIRALVWEPDGLAGSAEHPRCILQILHGMTEHIERYRDFAAFCTDQGFVVCGHDHIGHGKSVDSPEKWGVLPPDGDKVLVEDAHQLRKLVRTRYLTAVSVEPAASETLSCPYPYIMFGHSMGSFILRVYLSRYSEGLTAAIICGTGHQPALLSGSGSLIARFLCATRGVEYPSKFLHNLSVGAYSKQIPNARTPLDWLSTDESVVDEYIASPNCGFMFSAGGNVTLMALTRAMVKRETVAAVPKDLPLLFIAGDEDPVGEKGAAVKRAVALFKDTGHKDVTLILYEGMRHEVLNEVGKEQVYDDILEWIDRQI